MAAGSWVHVLTRVQVGVDAVAVLAGATAAKLLRFGTDEATLAVSSVNVSYTLLVPLALLVWLAVLAFGGCYDPRVLGAGNDQYRRVVSVGVHFFAIVAAVHFVFDVDIARGFVGALIPLTIVATVIGRHTVRKLLHRRRSAGQAMYDVVAVGARREISALVRHLHRTPWAGYRVVGACFTDLSSGPLLVGADNIPDLGNAREIVRTASVVGASVVAVAGTATLPEGMVQRVGWELEGSGVDLVVAPDVFDVAGPRIQSRPVAGLPLLHVDVPRLGVGARMTKAMLDRVGSAFLLVLATPVIAVAAVAVKRDSPGPAFYRQLRVGRHGKTFECVKLRSMVDGADALIDELALESGGAGPMFKVRDDPRVTRVGRFLRRHSLDELPQLWQVLTGHMSLVGPRPPLPAELQSYDSHVHRRLLVRPGLTGLWQVSGRSDLDWEESIRLDIYYVDNWSLALDLATLLKTVTAVFKGKGAY